MKKLAKGLLAGLLVFPIAGIFTACDGGEPININDATVSLSYTQVDYNGSAKTPEVKITYKGETIDRDEYSVTYENNINAGTAYAIIKASRDSDELVGSVTLNFTINKSDAYVNTYAEIIKSLSNANYKSVVLEDNVTVPYGATLNIASNKVIDFAEYTLANYGTIQNNGTIYTTKNFTGNGSVINDGDIIASVSTVEGMLEAFEYSNYISLAKDIIKADGYLGDIRFVTKHDYEFTLDLNGNTLESELDIFKYEKQGDGYIHYPHSKVNITITDTSLSRAGSLGSSESDYGLYVWGTSNYNINIVNATLRGKWGGLYTNGNSADANITATNSKFAGGELGVYAAGNNTHIYTNCEFTGDTGYYTKSGSHTFNDCSFYANGEFVESSYYGNGANLTGCALNIDSCKGYTQVLAVEINGGFFKSENGYGIYEFSTAKAGEEKISYGSAAVSGNVIYLTALNNIQSDNNSVSVQ